MCEWTKPYSSYGYDLHRRRGILPACDACKAALAEWQADYRKRKPEVARRTSRKANYGITDQDYQTLLAAQDYACKICRKPFEDIRRGRQRSVIYIDHDHSCDHAGKKRSCPDCVRGLLCPACNHFLVILEDKENLKRAVEYLQDNDAAEIIRQSRLW